MSDAANKSSVLSYAELMQSVGLANLQHSWDSALESFSLAAHCVLPIPSSKESDKVQYGNHLIMLKEIFLISTVTK